MADRGYCISKFQENLLTPHSIFDGKIVTLALFHLVTTFPFSFYFFSFKINARCIKKMMQIWDVLRPLTEAAYAVDVPVKFLVFFLSLGILVVAVLAFRKTKSRRFLLVGLAFAFFAAKWALKIIDIFYSPGIFLGDASENVFELLILAMLFLAIFKK